MDYLTSELIDSLVRWKTPPKIRLTMEGLTSGCIPPHLLAKLLTEVEIRSLFIGYGVHVSVDTRIRPEDVPTYFGALRRCETLEELTLGRVSMYFAERPWRPPGETDPIADSLERRWRLTLPENLKRLTLSSGTLPGTKRGGDEPLFEFLKQAYPHVEVTFPTPSELTLRARAEP
ncbi:MAG: hypothetical protein QM811_17905 [Pirellulales bacterium]